MSNRTRRADELKPVHQWPSTQPLMRLGPRVKRNEKCPCGSGLKFKKCCGANNAQD